MKEQGLFADIAPEPVELPDREQETDQIREAVMSTSVWYKNFDTFHNDKHATCYVPEGSDTEYNYFDFVYLAGNDLQLAERVFNLVSWQHPETLLDEMANAGEV